MIKLNKDTNSVIDDLSKYFYTAFVASASDGTNVTDVSEHDVAYVDAFIKQQAAGFAQYYVRTKGILGVYTNGNYKVAIFSDGMITQPAHSQITKLTMSLNWMKSM